MCYITAPLLSKFDMRENKSVDPTNTCAVLSRNFLLINTGRPVHQHFIMGPSLAALEPHCSSGVHKENLLLKSHVKFYVAIMGRE